MSTRYAEKLMRMVRFGDDLAGLATDPRIKVGCVVFPVDCSSVAGIGYNGAAAGLDHGSINLAGPIGSGGSGAAHAEANALIKAGRLTEPTILYTSTAPCPYCAPLIVNATQVVGVVYGSTEKLDRSGVPIVQAAGIPMVPRSMLEVLSALQWEVVDDIPRQSPMPSSGHSVDLLRAARVVSWWRSLRRCAPSWPASRTDRNAAMPRRSDRGNIQ